MTISVDRPAISDDASAILLLCARLGKRTPDGAAPLSIGEYDAVADVLKQLDLRPGNLLRSDRATVSSIVERLAAKARGNVPADRLARLMERGAQLALALAKWSSHGIWVSTRADSDYPSRYKNKLGRSAPPVVFGIGPRSLLDAGGIAVVGSRHPDLMSEDFARRVGRWAADSQVQVVSGAARGVDQIAMLSCFEHGGTALGVVAESLLRQSTHREFRNGILANRLTLISSYDPEAPFTAANAMGRNRWVYALADRGLVVAAKEGRGGTWAGAVEALKRGVPVFVLTGNPQRPGNEALLPFGARPAPSNLAAMLEQQPVTALVRAPESDPAGDIFSAVVPFIIAALRKPSTVKELADAVEVTPSQLKVWLAKMVATGSIVKTASRYHVANGRTQYPAESPQISLLPPEQR